MNQQVIDVLNKQVADWGILYVKLHNYHWYVKGSDFFTLHTKFEELYTEAAVHFDDIAERILAIQGKPVATMKEYLALSTIEEGTYEEDSRQMVATIKADFEIVLEDLTKGMTIAQEANDEMTSDLLLGIHTELEKHVWMLNAFLG
ncbi:Dps family protein [Lysinibacillus piscis]|uniref:DNA starvation/stationary phase protection protein n=1 Tax=Lysinibacillus piscis TaxID=2518931 RepID=A0ABQ5NNV3_9BACI|nr:Dps family protein [Lysinibacillus sp. KH24]GLC89674.1 DNA starvation/stationary phase protection protein [Lysinibacillus sp. KH24]